MSGSHARVILVTGANRGIGFAIIQSLALHASLASSTAFLLGCRSVADGEAAIATLHTEHGLPRSAMIRALQLDVNSDASILAAVAAVTSTYGRLDVLINNAGYAAIPPALPASPAASDLAAYRTAFADVHSTNVTSVALLTQLFLPLLRRRAAAAAAAGPGQQPARVINVSSARASVALLAAGDMPPSVSVPYSISKTALNVLTIEMARQPANASVWFACVSPGHCKTAFNGYRGARDPVEGARVVLELVVAPPGAFENAGFWETRGASGVVERVAW